MVFTVNEVVTIVLSAIAIVVSVISVYYAHTAQTTSCRFVTIERHYDAFIEFSRLRLENWQVSHLFETPDNYAQIKGAVQSAFRTLFQDQQEQLLLKERACAAIIFTQYESTLYQIIK